MRNKNIIQKSVCKKCWLWLVVVSLIFTVAGCENVTGVADETSDGSQSVTETISTAPKKGKTKEKSPEKETTSNTPEEDQSEDTSPNKFVEDVKKAIQGCVGENEFITDVTLKDKDLCVYVDFSQADSSFLTMDDLAKSRTSAITDAILEFTQYDSLWSTITVDFGDVGKIQNPRRNIERGEHGRYFPSENFVLTY